uniref:B-cell receptor CD22 n=1 Tax=Cyclopterus lumpus TaxID=8103 RepID=A0A8C2ZVA9_CYCLU
MRIDNRDLTWSLMPLFLAGVLCNTLTVYHQEHICAVEGSTVVIPCSFYYPDTHSVKRFVWLHVKSHHVKGRLIYDRTMTKVTPRFQYIGDKKHNCTSKIQQVEHRDAGKYIFRFITNSKEGKWIRIGSTLKVVDLNVSVTQPGGNRTTKEGDSVNLTCLNVCDDGPLSSAFSWRKNGEPIDEGPALYLSNMSSTHSGNYTCSLKTHTGTTSGVIHIDVEYGPKNTSVSVRSMEEVAASNITLTCSSHANPPVNYTWFKIDDDDDDVDIVDVGHRPDFLPADGGQYFCSATNKHGSQNSSVVTLKMKRKQNNVCVIQAICINRYVFLLFVKKSHYHTKKCTVCYRDVTSRLRGRRPKRGGTSHKQRFIKQDPQTELD